MYNDETNVKHKEHFIYINSNTIVSKDTLTKFTRDILGDVNIINDTFIFEEEETDGATSYEIVSDKNESCESTYGNKTEEKLKEVHMNDDPRVILSNIRKKH